MSNDKTTNSATAEDAKRPSRAPGYEEKHPLRQRKDRPWSEYPIGTKAHSINGGHWTKTDRGWKWCNGDTFPTPGGDAFDVTLPPMQLEDYYKRNLKKYLKEGRKNHANGTSHMQRVCRIGYNQACHTIKYGIEKGILTQDGEKEHLHRIAS